MKKIREEIVQMIESDSYISELVDKNSNLYTNFAYDSLSFITLLVKIEDAYDITFEISDMERCLEVEVLITLVETKIREKSAMNKYLVHNHGNMEKAAVIDGETIYSFRDLLERIGTMQQSLPHKQGGKVAIYLPNNFDHIAAYFSVILSGMTAVPLNVQMTEHEILPLLEWVDVCAVITSKQDSAMFEKLTGCEHSGLSIICAEDICWHEITTLPVAAPRNADAPMVLLSTSGTTGNAKIVQLSQRNIETSVFGYLDKVNFEEDSTEDIRYVLATPFSSAYGIMILSSFMIRAFTIVLFPSKFTLETLYKTIEEYRVTHYEGGPLPVQLMSQMAGRPNPYNISSLKNMGFGGGKISADETKSLESAYPQIIFAQGYGMSETSPLVSKHQCPNIKKTESVGTAIKGVEIAVEANGVITKDAYVKGEVVIRVQMLCLVITTTRRRPIR